MTVYYTPKDIR